MSRRELLGLIAQATAGAVFIIAGVVAIASVALAALEAAS